jgi:regulatory protein
MAKPPRPPSSVRSASAPDMQALHEAALAHLARYGATKATLQRALDRRVERWAREARLASPEDQEAIGVEAAAARDAVRSIVTRLAEAGAVDDAAFAAGRARRLLRAGRSYRAVAAHLAERGIDRETTRAALPEDEEAELAAALMLSRRRRIGPFRSADAPDEAGRRRELAVLARAGFGRAVASRALGMALDDAEPLLRRLREP